MDAVGQLEVHTTLSLRALGSDDDEAAEEEEPVDAAPTWSSETQAEARM